MIARLLANFLGAPEIPHDLVEKTEDGQTYKHSESEGAYFIPSKTLDAVISAPPARLESLLMRRLARLTEWEDQHPEELFVRACPGGGAMMHLINYPAVSMLRFMRSSEGIWITEKQLSYIHLHDPCIDGAQSMKVATEDDAAEAREGDVAEDEEGNEVESGVGGFPAEKGDMGEVTKVWIIPGCIVCDLCESIEPSVFHVTETTSTVQMPSQAQWTAMSTTIVEAAVGCPVDVIKYELKE